MMSQPPTKNETNFNHSAPPPAPPTPRRSLLDRIAAWNWPRRHVVLTLFLIGAWIVLVRWVGPGKYLRRFEIIFVVVLGLALLLLLFAILRWRLTEHLLKAVVGMVLPVLLWLVALMLLAGIVNFLDWNQYAIWGSILIGVFGLVWLFVPCWWVVLSPGDIYYVRRWRAPTNQFGLVTYRGPNVDQPVLDRLVELGVPKADLHRLLEYGGLDVGLRRLRMTFTHDLNTRTELPPDKQNRDGLAWFDELERQVADPAKQRETVIWFAPIDHVWRLWNRRETVAVEREITGLVTKNAGTLEIELKFSCEFDPLKVKTMEFYMGLSGRRTIQSVKELVQAVMGRGAERAALTFFVGREFEDALAEAAINDFKQVLFDALDWADFYLGIAIEKFSFQCRPLVPYPVALAQQHRVAYQARAEAEYYKIDALIRQAEANGMSVEMIGRLQYLIQEMDGLRRPPQDLFPQTAAPSGQPARMIGSTPGALGNGAPAQAAEGGQAAPASGATGAEVRHFDRSIDYDAIQLFRDEDGVYRPRQKD